MPVKYDVAVLGLGAMGAATAWRAAARGASVVGVEQFTPGHARGSSHGGSRIYRQTLFEGIEYVPLARRAFELWTDLEAETGTPLFRRTGGLCIGPEDGPLISDAVSCARDGDVAIELLDAGELTRALSAARAASRRCRSARAGGRGPSTRRPACAAWPTRRRRSAPGWCSRPCRPARVGRRRRAGAHRRRGHPRPPGGARHRVPGSPTWCPSWACRCGCSDHLWSGSAEPTRRRTGPTASRPSSGRAETSMAGASPTSTAAA